MEKIIIVIEKSKDHFGAYSENCDGIYAAGGSSLYVVIRHGKNDRNQSETAVKLSESQI